MLTSKMKNSSNVQWKLMAHASVSTVVMYSEN